MTGVIIKRKQGRVMVHACNPSTREAEAGRSQVLAQPGIHCESLFQKKNKNEGKHRVKTGITTGQGGSRSQERGPGTAPSLVPSQGAKPANI
jgi:hypothetical protein